MIKPDDPRELAVDILERSICAVKVGCAIADSNGIFSWGWNSVGSGFGIHAEVHAIGRANKRRLRGALVFVASTRRTTTIISKPCNECQALIDKWELRVVWRNKDGEWIYE